MPSLKTELGRPSWCASLLSAVTSTEARLNWFSLGVVVVLGVSLGLGLPNDEGGPEDPVWARTSTLIGWTYFAAWTASFWPQTLLNFSRWSCEGMSYK